MRSTAISTTAGTPPILVTCDLRRRSDLSRAFAASISAWRARGREPAALR